MYNRSRFLTLILCLAPAFASAHHGTRFLLAVEYDMVRQPFAFATGTYEKFRHSNDLELEPAYLMPVGNDGLTEFELHAHIERENSEPLRHEATGFEIRRRLNRSPDWNFAASLEYETAVPHTGNPNNWTGTFVAGKENSRGLFLLNLLAEQDAEKGAKPLWSYRAAWSPTPNGLINFSLEVQGDMEKHGSHEVVVGVMQHLDLETMVKVGIGTGLTSDSPQFSFRLGLVRAL